MHFVLLSMGTDCALVGVELTAVQPVVWTACVVDYTLSITFTHLTGSEFFATAILTGLSWERQADQQLHSGVWWQDQSTKCFSRSVTCTVTHYVTLNPVGHAKS